MRINKKKFIYLISPNKIRKSFYNDLIEVLKSKKVSFFQLRLKNISFKKKLIIGKKIKKICKKYKIKFLTSIFNPIDYEIIKSLKLDSIKIPSPENRNKELIKLCDKKFKNVLLCNNLISDWIDTAIIVSRLDEVITVDTSLAHIAGTLNIPTKIMISKVPDWRWGIKENTTEWYKSVKLLRQKNSGDWESIINNLANKLSSKTRY